MPERDELNGGVTTRNRDEAGPHALVRQALDWATFGLTAAALALVLFVDGPAFLYASGAAAVTGLAIAALDRRVPRTPLDWWVIAYVAASAVAAIANWGPVAQGGLLLTVVLAALYTGAATSLRSTWRIRVLIAIFVVGVLHIGLLATHYHALIGLDRRPDMYPVVARWSGYPEIGLLAALAIGMMAGLLFTRQPWWFTIAGAGVSFVLAIHLFVSYARGAWVGAVVAVLVVAGVAGVRSRPWRTIAAILVMASVAAGTVSLVWNPYLGQFLQESRTATAGSFLARIDVWKESWPLIADHWLVGVGPGRYGEVMNAGYAIKARGWSLHAHNTEIHVWAERGVVGVGALVGLWLHAMWLLVRRRRTDRGVSAGAIGQEDGVGHLGHDLRPALLGALVALFTRAQFEHPFDGIPTSPRFALLFWLFLALSVAASGLVTTPSLRGAPTRSCPPPVPPEA